jgi:phosphatidylglycerophosphatase A
LTRHPPDLHSTEPSMTTSSHAPHSPSQPLVLEAGETRRVRPTGRFMMSHPAHMIAFGFGAGLSPIMPGTVGTLYAWLSFLALSLWVDPAVWFYILPIAFVVGIWASATTSRNMGVADHGAIVWDEIVAFWLVLLLVTPTSFWGQLGAFLLFRLFDIVKPAPIGYYDRALKVRGWLGGFGVMFDDLIAAFYTLLLFALWRSF